MIRNHTERVHDLAKLFDKPTLLSNDKAEHQLLVQQASYITKGTNLSEHLRCFQCQNYQD